MYEKIMIFPYFSSLFYHKNLNKKTNHLKTSNIRQNNLKNRYKIEQYKSTKDREISTSLSFKYDSKKQFLDYNLGAP